jgi:phage baseplate assembly protein W
MAVILGQKYVSEASSVYSDIAIGITLPITLGKGYFRQSYTTTEQVKTNMKSLLLTKRGERVMQPALGSGLHEIVFDFNDDNLPITIQNTIEDTLTKWMPYVSIANINVQQTTLNKDNNRVEISITFSINRNISYETLTFIL